MNLCSPVGVHYIEQKGWGEGESEPESVIPNHE